MNEPDQETVVFLSEIPEDVRKAVTLLEGNKVPHKIVSGESGDFSFSRAKHIVLVSQCHAVFARELVSGIESEVVLEKDPEPDHSSQIGAWILLMIAIICVVIGVFLF